MISGIYTITNNVNGKIYVGFATNLLSRKSKHFRDLSNNIHKNLYLQREYNKYGHINFEFETLEECKIEFLASQEHYWVLLLSTNNRKFGYNIRPTHPYGKIINSPEIRRKISTGRKGILSSSETKAKIKLSLLTSEAFKLRDSGKGMRGKHHSEISKDKLSKSHKGKRHTEETRKKISDSQKGKIMAEDVIRKIIETRKSNGYKHSEETKRKIEESNRGKKYVRGKNKKGYSLTDKLISYHDRLKKKVLQMDINNNIIKEWESATHAARMIGISQGTISNCCRGIKSCKSYKGYIWKYKEN